MGSPTAFVFISSCDLNRVAVMSDVQILMEKKHKIRSTTMDLLSLVFTEHLVCNGA